MTPSVVGWLGVLFALFVATFGVWNFVVILSCSSFFFGSGLLLMYFRGITSAQVHWNLVCTSRLAVPSAGIRKIEELVLKPVKQSKCDKRLTGASAIDEPLQEVLQYTLRDYVQPWYGILSDDDNVLNDLRETAQNVIIAFSNRAKEVEWVPYLTTRLVDDFASHLRLFRQALYKFQEQKQADAKVQFELVSIFFDLETDMENNMCRDLVSTLSQREKEYLQDLCEVLLFLLLPPGDFHNKPFRYLARELLVNIVFLPTVEQFSDPDYVNQIIVWLCKDMPVSSEVFLTVVRLTDNVDELSAVRERVSHEIAVQRSKDSGGEDDAEIKQQLSSLMFVLKTVDNRIRRLQDGIDTDSVGLPSNIDWKRLLTPGQKLFSLPLDVVLKNNVALSYFIDYMLSVNGQGYLYFYLNIEGFRVSAEQQISAAHLNKLTNPDAVPTDLDPLREAALNIYDQYLSEKAVPRVNLDEQACRRLLGRLRTETPTEAWFDEIRSKVYEILQEERFFPTFKRSSLYIKLLAELDLLKDTSKSDEDDIQSVDDLLLINYDSLSLSSLEETCSDTSSLTSFAAANTPPPPPLPPDITMTADIVDLAVIKDSNKQYAVYAIDVLRKDGTGKEDRWQVYRRYSDFHDFHMSLQNKFGNTITLIFPAKKTFNNMNPQFLDKRMKLLNEYLQCLLTPDLLKSNSGLLDLLHHFLEPVSYEKSKGQFQRKVDNFKNSMRTVGKSVRSVPDNFLHSVDGMMDGISRVLHARLHGNMKLQLGDSSKVAAGLDVEGDDNIPLRIMLLLMDEIFDLKSRNQWLRRRIVTILRQIIKATFGDRINRKIIDSVAWYTSAQQVSEYVKAFKQAFWPNGCLALPAIPRDDHTKMRTRVAAKMAMLTSLPEELKHIIGSETTRKGMLLVFEMFQQNTLNRRLVFVLLEGILETLFPDNKFGEIFRKLHSRSPRVKPNGDENQQQVGAAS